MSLVYAGIGSRETPDHCLERMEYIAEGFAGFGYTLRSGGARGADTAFERGCDKADGAKRIYRAEDATPAALALAADVHPNWDACSSYAKKLHARNCLIVLGDELDDPVDIIVCWTPGGKIQGGTGQALRLAELYDIRVANLADGDG